MQNPSPWIQVGSGALDFSDIESHKFDIEFIARSLSRLNRWNGGTCRPISVVEHCLACSTIVSSPFQLEALMHDAAEAYLGDLSSPAKRLCPGYVALEKRIQAAIEYQFGLDRSREAKQAVHLADMACMFAEAERQLPPCSRQWSISPADFPGTPEVPDGIFRGDAGSGGNPLILEKAFLEAFRESREIKDIRVLGI
jgi:hypothetical protein